jgi:conjugal transfer mating pair stabilization protein TraG
MDAKQAKAFQAAFGGGADISLGLGGGGKGEVPVGNLLGKMINAAGGLQASIQGRIMNDSGLTDSQKKAY